MPVLVNDPAMLERLKRGQQAVEHFHHNLDEIRARGKRYVVILGDDVLAAADDPVDAWREAGGERAREDGAILLHVPMENESYFF